jgi:VIT1/CCC1 family predicted Fe2+/Mn2+ transporter
MKNTGVIGSFIVSIALFVLSYLALDEGYVWLFYLIAGIVMAVFGAYIAVSRRD